MRFNMDNIRRRIIFPIILTLFILVFYSPNQAAEKQCVWTGVEKIVAIGDLHGAYDNFVKILKGLGIVDENLNWIAGKTHLVQEGDIMDRGYRAKDVLDLLRKLEDEAEKAGGKVHVLLGNHEEMNISGIALDYEGYVTIEQFVSFLPEKFRKKKEKNFLKKAGGDGQDPADLDLSSNENLRKYWLDLKNNNIEAKRLYVNHFNDEYGKWLLEHNAVIKINDIIFVHGGISKRFSTWKLEDINKETRSELNFLRKAARFPSYQQRPFNPQIAYRPDSPLWYRELAINNEAEYSSEVDEILKNLGATHMVIAHTPQLGSPAVGSEYQSRFMEKIWIIDTGISHHAGGFLAGLIIENGKFIMKDVGDENNE